VTGAHRSTTHSRVTAAGVATTLGTVLITVAVLAVMVPALYFGLTRQADAQSSVVAIQSAALLLWLGVLISLLRKRSLSPEWLVAVIGKAGLCALMAVGLIIDVGRLLGWNSSLVYALLGISGLVAPGCLAYSFGGERRLLALLQARAAGRQGPA
jgi:peptidoglycan/LPS O-acetylase OafA/YrhL